jgi:hypothetical protein
MVVRDEIIPDKCTKYFTRAQGRTNKERKSSLHFKLKQMGLITAKKFIPDCYKINSRKNRLELLAGLLDTDGYLSNGCFEIISAYPKLAKDILFLARSLGFMATTAIKRVKGYDKDYYRIVISGNISEIPTKVPRKKAEPRKINKNALVSGFTVVPLKEDQFYGFELKENPLHLLDSFIVSHNTIIAMNIIKEFVEQGIVPYYLSKESTSGFVDTAMKLGLKEGDFKYYPCHDATKVEFEPDAVTIIDWLKPDEYKDMDKIFDDLHRQLVQKGGLLIVFMQLKDNNDWFSKNLVDHFASLAVKYLYTDDGNGEFTSFEMTKIRRRLTKRWIKEIPCRYEWETCRIKRMQEVLSESAPESNIDEENLKVEKLGGK